MRGVVRRRVAKTIIRFSAASTGSRMRNTPVQRHLRGGTIVLALVVDVLLLTARV